MMKYKSIFRALLLLAATAGAATIVSAKDDMDGFCAVRNVLGRDGVDICQVPIERLLAAPEKYDGKLVRVTGWLVWHNERYVLYGSRDRFLGSSGEGGIPMLDIGLPQQVRDAARTEEGINGVTITAVFEKGPSAKIAASPGSFKKLSNVYLSPLIRDLDAAD